MDIMEFGSLNPLPSHEGRRCHKRGKAVFERLNPLPSHEGRPKIGRVMSWQERLNPLPSHEGRPKTQDICIAGRGFKSTPFSRRETDFPVQYRVSHGV